MNHTIKVVDHGDGIIEIADQGCIIHTADDLMGLFIENRCSSLIIKRENMREDFFDLSTGIAGELLQKVSNYRKRLGITGDYKNTTGKALKDFIYESNKTGEVIFVDSAETALRRFRG